jgi:hypothetical protein
VAEAEDEEELEPEVEGLSDDVADAVAEAVVLNVVDEPVAEARLEEDPVGVPVDVALALSVDEPVRGRSLEQATPRSVAGSRAQMRSKRMKG